MVTLARPLVLTLIATQLGALSYAQSITRLGAGSVFDQKCGATQLTISHVAGGVGPPSATIAFDHDALIGENNLPAGRYGLTVEPLEGGRAHLVLSRDDEEELRYALRTHAEETVAEKVIVVEIGREEPRRRRRRRREPTVELHLLWNDRRATVELQLSNVIWRSTAAPEVPAELTDAWKVVKSSLSGFVNQSMDQHVEHFSEDFQSDWDDGGSQEAHMQMVGRMLFEGEFEDTVLQLADLTWEAEGDRVVFRGATVLAPFGASPLVYTVERRGRAWKIVHLDGPKQD